MVSDCMRPLLPSPACVDHCSQMHAKARLLSARLRERGGRAARGREGVACARKPSPLPLTRAALSRKRAEGKVALRLANKDQPACGRRVSYDQYRLHERPQRQPRITESWWQPTKQPPPRTPTPVWSVSMPTRYCPPHPSAPPTSFARRRPRRWRR